MNKHTSLNENKVDRQTTVAATDEMSERRREQRLYYHWPIWFSKESAKAFAPEKRFQGQMLSVSSDGAAFTYCAEEISLHQNEQIIARFRVPRFGSSEPFSMALFTRAGHVSGTYDVDNSRCKAIIQFDRPLFFNPGEQGVSEYEAQQKLKGMVIDGLFGLL
ncbi:MAG: hypothetical protein ACYSYV_00510 [Planctomycetota bacterium]|jgi:hypothetical protein